MSAPTPDRPPLSDDLVKLRRPSDAGGDAQAAASHAPDGLDLAYRDATALAADGRQPAPSVRASVLAAARDVAQQGAAGAPVPAQGAAGSPSSTSAGATGVDMSDSPSIAPAGRGRPAAANLSSWRLRAGGAACVALLAAITGWRLNVGHGDTQETRVASASLSVARRDAAAPVAELPLPSVPMPSAPADAVPAGRSRPPQALRDAAVPAEATRARQAARKTAEGARPRDASRGADIVVAQAGTHGVTPPPARQPAPARPAPGPLAISAATVPSSDAMAAQGVEVTGATASRFSGAAPTSPVRIASSDVARSSLDEGRLGPIAPAAPLLASSARALATPLQVAADRGDLDALTQLLANPSVAVDAPDAAGRTALMHAVLSQQAAAVRALLAAGADPARADHAGLTPRAAARAGASADIAALLEDPGR
jgi:hypothetical protein